MMCDSLKDSTLESSVTASIAPPPTHKAPCIWLSCLAKWVWMNKPPEGQSSEVPKWLVTFIDSSSSYADLPYKSHAYMAPPEVHELSRCHHGLDAPSVQQCGA
eukprot:4175999-Amphidinium_carterae.1